jgi:hypothetical protein
VGAAVLGLIAVAKIMFEASGGEKIRGTPYYDSDSYSLDFRPADASANGVASLLVDDVQIEIDEAGRALWIWGLCPHLSWVPRNEVVPPPAKEGVLQALLDQEVIPGVSRRIAEAWPITASTRHRWLCIGNLGVAETDALDAVEFATDTVAVLSAGKLEAIWVRLARMPELKGADSRAAGAAPGG